MTTLRIILLFLLIACTAAVSLSRHLLVSISIYLIYSLIMAAIWLLMESPDLAITEAAVGAGVTGILFFILLKKIRRIRTTADKEIREEAEKKERKFRASMSTNATSEHDM